MFSHSIHSKQTSTRKFLQKIKKKCDIFGKDKLENHVLHIRKKGGQFLMATMPGLEI
jgi:hypothetical protein